MVRTLRKEGFNQEENDHLFHGILMPILVYGLSVYEASSAALNSVQLFLDCCCKKVSPAVLELRCMLHMQVKNTFLCEKSVTLLVSISVGSNVCT